MSNNFLVYGATGYTGELIVRYCREFGLSPIIAGRDAEKIKQLAQQYKTEYRVFSLDDKKEVAAGLAGVALVLHCAGPFRHTSASMVEACLQMGVHYLDITGEIEVFETLARRDAEAKKAGVMIMPGVGFDVVPSDCLATHLKHRMPDATHLTMAFQGLGVHIAWNRDYDG